jgi:hypothetical protein
MKTAATVKADQSSDRPARRRISVGEVGKRIYLDGQKYELIRIEDYQNRFSEMTKVYVWRSTCAEPGCEQSFETTMPAGYPPENRRCPEHHQPRKTVRRKLKRAQRSV